jgi:hypothetical protein
MSRLRIQPCITLSFKFILYSCLYCRMFEHAGYTTLNYARTNSTSVYDRCEPKREGISRVLHILDDLR